ncbi:MAG: rRNA methyltransferase [Flavobacteriales bacterium]|nr:MAG: rRNA methyltransferase [Flavobacteriales bacterium]
MKNLTFILDQLKPFLTEERWTKIQYYAKESSDFVLPVLEDVYQHRNAAAIVRSAEACAFHKVLAMEKRNKFEQNLSVTKGADTWVEVERISPSLSSIEKMRNDGYKIVAVSPEKNAISLPDYQIKEPMALIFGTEWEGVSEDILEEADETLAIPMYGFTKSFNVSVAAAICMYQLKQKLVSSSLNYHLTEEKRTKLMIRWAINSIRSGENIYRKIVDDNNLKDIL